MKFIVLCFVALLLFAFQVSRCHSKDLNDYADFGLFGSLRFRTRTKMLMWNGDAETETEKKHTMERFDLRRKLFGAYTVEPCQAVVTSCVFPINSGRSFVAGMQSAIRVRVRNNGKSELVMSAILASVHPPNDHNRVLQQLLAKGFFMQFVKPSTKRAFTCSFVISRDLQVGIYDLAGTVFYVMDDTACNTTFFNGTIEIVETRVMVLTKVFVKIAISIIVGFSSLYFLWRKCAKMYQSWEDKKRAKIEAEEAAMKWLLEETKPAAQSSSKKKKKSKKK